MNKHTFTVATANTYFGKAIRTTGGLTPIKNADVILFQEVFTPKANRLDTILTDMGFTLVHAAPRFGLAIALKNNTNLKYVEGSLQEHCLAKMPAVEKLYIEKAMRLPLVLIERGLISCQIVIGKQPVTIATVHPTTPVSAKPRARYRQIVTLGKIISRHYANDALILGGDMNHYPRPRSVDHAFHTKTDLSPVDLGSEPTWYAKGSKQERILSVLSKFLRRPLDHFNGQHDIILYRKHAFRPIKTEVVDIPSDHRSIITTFEIA